MRAGQRRRARRLGALGVCLVSVLTVASCPSVIPVASASTAPAPYTASDGTTVTIGEMVRVINADDIELSVHCLASPSGSCAFGGEGGLKKTSSLAQPVADGPDQVAYGGGSLYPLSHQGVGVNLYPLVIPVGSSGTVWFSMNKRTRPAYERFLRLGSVMVDAVICSHYPCVVTKIVVLNPAFPPTTESYGAAPVPIGSATLDVSHAEPPPPTYVYLSNLTVRPNGEARITMRCTSSHLLHGKCIVTDLEAEAPGGQTPTQRFNRWLFLRKSVVLERGRAKTERLYYRTRQAAGSPTPSASQRGVWSRSTKATIGTGICDSHFYGCHASRFNAYGNAGITAELIQLDPPELPSHMPVKHG